MFSRKWLALLFPIVLATVFAAKTLWDAGEFKTITPIAPGPCRQVEGVFSSEDLTIDEGRGRAYVSAADRRGRERGAIFSFDLTVPEAQPVQLTTDFSADFHPHGIDLFESADGRRELFVINHRSKGHFVERFELSPDDHLRHLESFSSDHLNSPNDLVVVALRQFYVTNDHRSRSSFGQRLEEYLQLARSYVLYYDGSRFVPAASGLAYANGINISPDGSRIYVASSVGRLVSVYQRDPHSGTLRSQFVIDAGTGVDNIEVDGQGNLWIGAHPKLLTFSKYAADSTVLSPSEVLKVSFFLERDFEIDRIYLNDGAELSGSSVAAVYRDKLLIGSVADRRFLVCRTGGESR